MSNTNRAALLTKTHKVLKKHYKPVAPPADRSVLDHLLYACCLENSKHEEADTVLAKLQQNYYDWNEVRVTTVSELAEVMAGLADPLEAAARLKRSLHSVFETHYAFDLEKMKKQNLGAAVQELEKFNGVTAFAVAYMTQNALGGHAIPVNQAGYELFVALGVISPQEAEKQRVTGLERTIPKSKGVEFGSMWHQLAVDYAASPHSSRIRAIVLEIAPDAKDRLPKRGGSKKSDGEAEDAEKKKSTSRRTKKKAAAAKSDDGSGTTKKKSSSKRLSRKKPR